MLLRTVIMGLGLILTVAIPVNVYTLFRRSLQQALPEYAQARGSILVLRWIGMLVLFVLGLALIAMYFLMAVQYRFSPGHI
jgi:hypothetical protein